MSRWLYLLILVWPLLIVPAHAGEKIGFIWVATEPKCSTTEIERTVYSPNLYGKAFKLQAMRVFLGAPAIEYTGKVDLGVIISHQNGQVIDVIQRDMYGQPSGMADSTLHRVFASPWRFGPTEGIEVVIGCNPWEKKGKSKMEPYITVIITAEGELE